jgi:hypothetical protein
MDNIILRGSHSLKILNIVLITEWPKEGIMAQDKDFSSFDLSALVTQANYADF